MVRKLSALCHIPGTKNSQNKLEDLRQLSEQVCLEQSTSPFITQPPFLRSPPPCLRYGAWVYSRKSHWHVWHLSPERDVIFFSWRYVPFRPKWVHSNDRISEPVVGTILAHLESYHVTIFVLYQHSTAPILRACYMGHCSRLLVTVLLLFWCHSNFAKYRKLNIRK